MTDKMQTQNEEFNALDLLVEQKRRLNMIAIVDDDYPEVRHDFERALANYIQKMMANGRFLQGNRYGLIKVS